MNKTFTALLLGCAVTSGTFTNSAIGATEEKATPQPQTNCTRSREFITALEYLRARKDFSIPEKDARKLADTVSAGCSGAAQRFIQVSALLAHSGFGAQDALDLGLRFSKATDVQTDAFTTIFKRAFLEDYLDLDLRASLRLALSLTLDYTGPSAPVQADFSRLVEFCVGTRELDLPRPQCAAFATRITRIGALWKSGVAKAFLDTFAQIRSEKGPNLPTGQALTIAEEIIAAGPGAEENFFQAYRYAISPKGLGLTVQESLGFARKMAQRQVPPPQP